MNEHIKTLKKMLYGLTIKPTWYEGATEDEKSKYDAKTKSKVAALECAIEIMSDAEKLNALRDNARKIADAIDGILGKADNPSHAMPLTDNIGKRFQEAISSGDLQAIADLQREYGEYIAGAYKMTEREKKMSLKEFFYRKSEEYSERYATAMAMGKNEEAAEIVKEYVDFIKIRYVGDLK